MLICGKIIFSDISFDIPVYLPVDICKVENTTLRAGKEAEFVLLWFSYVRGLLFLMKKSFSRFGACLSILKGIHNT